MPKPSIHPWIAEMQGVDRKGIFMAGIGVPGSGKSTLMKTFLKINKRNLILPANMMDAAQTYPSLPRVNPMHRVDIDPLIIARNNKVLTFYLPNVRDFRGTQVVNVDVFDDQKHKESFFKSLGNTNKKQFMFTDGGLFVDDARNYIATKGSLPQSLQTFFASRRHLMLDIFFSFHGFNDINVDLIKLGMRFMVFRTDLPPSDAVMDKIALKEDLLKCISIVNEKSKRNPHFYMPFDPTDHAANEWAFNNIT
jgi:hypothetical protein